VHPRFVKLECASGTYEGCESEAGYAVIVIPWTSLNSV